MKKIKISAIIIALALVIVLSLVLINFQSNEQTIKIGWIGPQTGQSAVLGMDSFVAAQIAVDEINEKDGINGRQVELIIEDDQYNIAKAMNAYNKLVNIDKVDILLMNTYGSIFALADQAVKDDVIILDPLDANSEIAGLNENIFALATDSESIAEVLAEHANDNAYDKAGILYWNSDNFMPLVERVFRENYKGEIVVSESYTAGTSNFQTSLTKMMSEDVKAIVLLGYDETGLAMKQARELGFKGQFYTTGTVTSPPLQEAAMGNAEGTIFAFWNAPKSQEPTKSFTEKFIAKQGRPVILDFAAYPTYDAVNVIALAIDNAGSVEVNKVKSELLKIQDYDGVTGDISFASDGSVRIRESAFVLENSLPVLVD